NASWPALEHPLFSPLPAATAVDILLAEIALNLEGSEDLVAPQPILDEVLDDNALEFGLRDLQRDLLDGEAISVISQAFYDMADTRHLHESHDVQIAQDGYRRLLDTYKNILGLSEACQPDDGGGVDELLMEGDLRINNVDST